MGCEYVLITGTHENTPQVVNTLYGQQGVIRSDSWQRLPAAITARAARSPRPSPPHSPTGWTFLKRCARRRNNTWQTLNAGFRPGMGQHIPDRFFWHAKPTMKRRIRRTEA